MPRMAPCAKNTLNVFFFKVPKNDILSKKQDQGKHFNVLTLPPYKQDIVETTECGYLGMN